MFGYIDLDARKPEKMIQLVSHILELGEMNIN
jgi:hypothetical protein